MFLRGELEDRRLDRFLWFFTCQNYLLQPIHCRRSEELFAGDGTDAGRYILDDVEFTILFERIGDACIVHLFFVHILTFICRPPDAKVDPKFFVRLIKCDDL